MKKKIIFAGPIDTRSGYGTHSRLLAKSLLTYTDEFDVSFISLKWGNTPMGVLSQDDKFGREILGRLMQGQITTDNKPDIFIHCVIPNEFQPAGKFNIGITAGTESTVCSPQFIEGCNRMDLILTPSEFTRDVLQNTIIDKKDKQTNQPIETLQVKTPIQILFEGVDTDVFKKTESKFDLSAIKEDFAFLFVGHWLQGVLGHDRKDIGMLVQTFIKTFNKRHPKNRPALILKTSGAGFSMPEYQQIVDKIQHIIDSTPTSGQVPSIYIINGELSDDEMNHLYNHPKVKSMISFTKGEGYGLPLVEFTLTGKPILCSDYSGPMDFLSREHGAIMLPGELVDVHPSAANEWLRREGKWFKVNYHYAQSLMTDVFDRYEFFIERSRKHIQYTKNNYSLAKMTEKFLDILRNANSFVKNVPQTITLPKLKKV